MASRYWIRFSSFLDEEDRGDGRADAIERFRLVQLASVKDKIHKASRVGREDIDRARGVLRGSIRLTADPVTARIRGAFMLAVGGFWVGVGFVLGLMSGPIASRLVAELEELDDAKP